MFAFAPYQIANSYGHFNLQQTQFLPFGILALLLLYERPTHLRALATGLVLAACVWTDLYYTFFLLFAWALIVVSSFIGAYLIQSAIVLPPTGSTLVFVGLAIVGIFVQAASFRRTAI